MPDAKPEPIGELRMAMIMAQTYWQGTSILEGALEIMRQVREISPEQFKQKDKS